MDKISFPYRAHSHLVLMHVISECGAWARQDLEVELVRRAQQDVTEPGKPNRKSLIDMMADNDVEACFLTKPNADFARRRGFKVIDLEPQHMIFNMTMSTSKKLVDERPDIIERVNVHPLHLFHRGAKPRGHHERL